MVLQDYTKSMRGYVDELKAIKAFIANLAISRGYQLIWILHGLSEFSRVTVDSSEDIKDLGDFSFSVGIFDPTNTFNLPEFSGLDILMITDGTDFTFNPMTTSVKSINTIVLSNNFNFKQQMMKHGRVFQT